MVHVHAKTALTEPVRPGVRQQSGSGEEWASSIPDGGRTGKAPGVERNGEQDQAPQVAFLTAADSNGDSTSSSQRQAAAISDGR